MRQRGFSQIDAAIAIAAFVLLAGAVYGVNVWWNGKIEAAKEAGRVEIRNSVLAERNQQLLAVQQKVAQLQAALLEAEARARKLIADAEEKGRKGVADAEARKEKFLDDVFAGRIRLHDPGRRAGAGCPESGGTAQGKPAGDPGVGDGTGGAELSVELTKFLGSEAARADKVVAKVWTLQGIVRACEERLR